MTTAMTSVPSSHAAVSGATVVALREVRTLSPRLTADYCEHYAALPVALEGGRLTVATWRDGVDDETLDDLALLFEAAAVVVLAGQPEGEVRAAIQRCYGAGAATAEGVIHGLGDGPASLGGGESPSLDDMRLDDLARLANEAPVVKLVNLLLLEALDARASDVHLEAYADGLRVRYRVDGVLQEAPSPPSSMTAAVVSRLKIMAELDIAERRVPQDGRIRLRLESRQVDVRVSTLPTLRGESVVLRLLDTERGRIGLADLGMADATLAAFRAAITRPHGIVLATGPTGSGKTTTLYAAVDAIRSGREKIVTVEDPVEYQLVGVPQVPVNDKVGVTFASALRALLRQDPDVMLVGEIRDPETAEVATQAALTGHLVLSTLHTNDAPGALTRLLELGVAPYLVASTVEAVLAQRLVRQVCVHCRAQTPARDAKLHLLAASTAPRWEPFVVTRGAGCGACRGTGYRGRVGMYEILVVDDALRGAILARDGAATLRRIAVERGMKTLRDDGMRLVAAGLTTPEDVARVTAE